MPHKVAVYDAVGGPDVDNVKDMRPDPKDPTGKKQVWSGHTIDRTRAGKFTLKSAGSFVTKSWPMSRIPFGAPLKVDPADKHNVLWKDKSGHWQSVRKTLNITKPGDISEAIVAENDALSRRIGGKASRTMPASWPFNDFGHSAWYIFDSRGNRSDQLLHETPENERQRELKKPIVLEHSHGCVHIDPAAVDEMVKKGYLANGSKFVVHDYKTDLPNDAIGGRSAAAGTGHYVIHFFPKAGKIVVYRQ